MSAPQGRQRKSGSTLDDVNFDSYTASDLREAGQHRPDRISGLVVCKSSEMTKPELFLSLLAVLLAAPCSAGLTWALRPLLLRHALARPNARSSHRVPTPQGAGIAVIAATLMVASGIIAYAGSMDSNFPTAVFGATLFMAMVGVGDDIKSIPVIPRLMLQAVAVGAIILAVPGDLRIVSACPFWIERGLLLLAGLWFVNLVNFMDGLDWMTVAEVVPITGAMIALGSLGEFPLPATIVAAALCGAIAGFAPFNRPVAKIFLGDVGSLPIGLLLGWCLLQLAFNLHLAAALLLPLYYLSDATLTLFRRMLGREPFWVAHRSHFYQRAIDNGFTVPSVVGEVFTLNIALAALAIASVTANSVMISILSLLTGTIAVALVLYRFSRRLSP
jgi:UDP-N-acetylmuramyl pentapeptide phosphotransferase/UDP-N-acetylglucosamine-1-phosphate transferase